MKIPKSHPRYESLIIREKLAEGFTKGLIHETGLIAHGRGEAFDYLIGEKTIDISEEAEKVSAALLLIARHPVISVNGNVASLVGKECIELSRKIPAKIEVNLFHRTDERVKKIVNELKSLGGDEILGEKPDAKIEGLEHPRGFCCREGIYSADVVLVPLEDGDRCEALLKMGKKVIAIDLNPLSRTSQKASVTVVDNVVRAIPNISKWIDKLRYKDRNELENMVKNWDNKKALKEVLEYISKRINSL